MKIALVLTGLLAGVFQGVVEGVVEPPLPAWEAGERKEMIAGGWFAGRVLLTNEPFSEFVEEEVPELEVGEPTAEEIAPGGGDGGDVREEFIAGYFAEKPGMHLVDPQGLLEERQRLDLEAFLIYHANDSSIDMYVYVFENDQTIPGDVREEEVVERLYSAGKPALILYYYLGNPQRVAMYLSPVLTDSVSAAEQRRAVESSVMKAFGSTDGYEQLEAFLVQMSIRIYWMERLAEGFVEAPDGGTVFTRSEKELVEEEVDYGPWIRIAAGGGLALLGVVLSVGAGFMWMKGRGRYVFPEIEVEPRLGGNHAAGIGAVISYASPAVSPASQRDQVPDYLRRA